MRIISGACRGKKLVSVPGWEIRPTSDRVREAIFNIIGSRVNGARILDLFAGTGAMGIESLSRGAALAVLIDHSPAACRLIRQNLDRCRLTKKADVRCHDLFTPLPNSFPTDHRFDLIFMDPPYRPGHVQQVIDTQNPASILTKNGLVVIEHDATDTLTPPLNGLDIFKQKKYSRTRISMLTRITADRP